MLMFNHRIGRQAPDPPQSCQARRCRAHLDVTLRQGTTNKPNASGNGRDSLTHTQALEGKDVKDLLSNVGSGGGAAASGPAAGGAAAGGAAEEAKEEEKEEGTSNYMNMHMHTHSVSHSTKSSHTNFRFREGRVRRGHGFRPF